MSQERITEPASPELEQRATGIEVSPDEQLRENISTVGTEAQETFKKMAELEEKGLLSPGMFNKLSQQVRRLQGAALFALLVNAAPAFAQDTSAQTAGPEAQSYSVEHQVAKHSNDTAITPSENVPPLTPEGMKPVSVENQIAGFSNDTVTNILEGASPLVVEGVKTLAEKEIKKLLEKPLAIVNLPENLQSIGDNMEKMTSGGTSSAEKIDSALNVAETINKYTAGKIPHVGLLTQLRDIYKNISEGKSAADTAGAIFRAVVAAKTLGLGPAVYDFLKARAFSTPEALPQVEQLP